MQEDSGQAHGLGRWLLAVAVVLSVIIVLIVVRTLLHVPLSSTSSDEIVVDIDDEVAAGHLAAAIRFVTVSHQDPAQRDEQAFEDFIAWIAATYPALGQHMQLQRFNDTLLYKWQGDNPALAPILLTGHYDVVPVIPGTENLWQQPPFGGVIADGIVWGRGALDDKSGVVGILEAANYLLQTGYQPARTVYLSFGHDEEVGGAAGAGKVAEALAAEGVQLAWSLDEGSFVFDGLLPGIEPMTAMINVAEKGSVSLEIVARGAGGHSSMPPKQTAVGILAAAIVKLEAQQVAGGLEGLSLQMFDTVSRYMPFLPRMMFANQWLFGPLLDEQLSGAATTNAMLRTTTAPTMLSGSIKSNVLPIEAKAVVNFRLHPRDSVASVVAHVERVIGANDPANHLEVRMLGKGNAASKVSDWNSAGYAAIEQSVRDIYGDVVITPGLMVAASDSRHYGKVADNAFRFNPLVVTTADLTGFHGTNEKISVANFGRGIRGYVQIIRNGSSE